MSESRTIHVTGKGNIKVRPDATRLLITVEGMEQEYTLAAEHSAKLAEKLRKEIMQLGFERKELKTVSFDVSRKTESYRDENDNYRTRFIGYGFQHDLKLEFPSDNELLGKVLFTLGHSEARPEFSIEYYVSDPENARNELLARAVKDSREKAQIIADSSGVKLGRITYIDYSWAEISLEYLPVQKFYSGLMEETVDSSYSMEMEPDDVSASDTVTITWEIE